MSKPAMPDALDRGSPGADLWGLLDHPAVAMARLFIAGAMFMAALDWFFRADYVMGLCAVNLCIWCGALGVRTIVNLVRKANP